jgi:ferredoxin
MPLTPRGREILKYLPGAALHAADGMGCEIVRDESRCLGCGRCVDSCPAGASRKGTTIDVRMLLMAPPETRRGALGAVLRRLARREPEGSIEVPERVRSYRSIVHFPERCLGCGVCATLCPSGAITKAPPEVQP